MAGNSTAGRSMSTKPVPKKTVAAVADTAAKAAAAAGAAATAGNTLESGRCPSCPTLAGYGKNRPRKTTRTDRLLHKAGRTTCRQRLNPPLAGRALIGFR